MHVPRSSYLIGLLWMSAATGMFRGQASSSAPQSFTYLAGTEYSQEIPTTEDVLGAAWGEKIFTPEEIRRYAQRLAEASPKVLAVDYGKTWEGRPLSYLVVSAPENLSRLEDIRQANRAAAAGNTAEPQPLPATVWLIYGVHGNEISSPNSALLTAYHLAAAQDSELVDSILQHCVVLIDPLQNPDGRARFTGYFEQTLGPRPDPDPQAAEHNETWPGGRSNHYLFDLNRDWFALTQPETLSRVNLYLEWYPQVVVDLHEMGGNSTYYFAPPASPISPLLKEGQTKWWERFGRNNAEWFDRNGISYFTREVYDAFYPGYGEGWPTFQGSIGMTYEQASVRGLVYRRNDQILLHFRDSVRHHFLAGLSTLETAARHSGELVSEFRTLRAAARDHGIAGAAAAFVLPAEPDAERVRLLVRNLLIQGIDVHLAEKPFEAQAVSHLTGTTAEQTFPAGSYVVNLRQPAGQLAAVLLSRGVTMDEEFLTRQERLRIRRERDEFYDVTAWSLPLLYNVSCYALEELPRLEAAPVTLDMVTPSPKPVGEARIGYLIPWGERASVRLLGALQQEGIRTYAADRPLHFQGTDFSAGTIIVPRSNNPDDLPRRIENLGAKTGARVYGIDSGWTLEGINLGSNYVAYLPPVRIAMAWGEPTSSSSAGALRYILEQEFDLPVTLLHTSQLARARLHEYDVIILPDSWGRGSAGYGNSLGDRGVERLKNWVGEGGTLVAVGAAAEWLTDKNVDLLASQLESLIRPTSKPARKSSGQVENGSEPETSSRQNEQNEAKPSPASLEELIRPERESPPSVPGAILRVRLDTEHWLAFGYQEELPVLATSRRVFTPLKLDRGRNVATYASETELILSGYVWKEMRSLLPNGAFLMHQPVGQGHVVAFAEDPAFRGFVVGEHLLLANAIFFGPAH
ncbi:MAG TPA: M14 family metallopeptidase [Acidobacteriota bacterium]|nr:M14 family metallopeptidase [Acidobacteriota bacterium]